MPPFDTGYAYCLFLGGSSVILCSIYGTLQMYTERNCTYRWYSSDFPTTNPFYFPFFFCPCTWQTVPGKRCEADDQVCHYSMKGKSGPKPQAASIRNGSSFPIPVSGVACAIEGFRPTPAAISQVRRLTTKRKYHGWKSHEKRARHTVYVEIFMADFTGGSHTYFGSDTLLRHAAVTASTG